MMIYMPKTGIRIPFSKSEFSEGGYRVKLCNQCLNDYKRSLLGKTPIQSKETACCHVYGCYHEASHMVSFSPEEIVFDVNWKGNGRLAEVLSVCDQEEDDETRSELEFETMRDYCRSRKYIIDSDDMEEIQRRGLDDMFKAIRTLDETHRNYMEER